MVEGPRLDDQLCFALYAASSSVARAYRPGLAEIGLTYPQYLVMMVLWETDGVTFQQLGNRLQQGPHGLTPVVHRLVDAGLATRTPDASDGRVTRIHLTAAGRDLAGAASATQADVACRTGLDPAAYASLRDTLRRLASTTTGVGGDAAGETRAGRADSSAVVASSLAALTGSSTVPVYVIDADGSVSAVSPAAAAALQWSAEDLLGRPAHATLHHSDQRGAPAPVDACPIQVGRGTERITRADRDTFWRGDGEPVPVWWVAMPLPDPASGTVRTVVVFDRLENWSARGTPEHMEVAGDVDTRLLVLGQLSELLGITDVDAGLHRVAALGASTLADWCVIDRLDDGRVTRAAIADRVSAPGELDRRLRPMPPLTTASTGSLGRVLRGVDTVAVDLFTHRRSVLTAATDALDREQAALFADLGAAHAFVVPLRARDHVLGAMTWVRTDPARPFTDTDILLASVFGFRVGLWLDNARLYGLQKVFGETMQRSLLTELPEPDHLHVVARYAPALDGMQVGGDWYDALFTHDRNLALTIGDVTGHDPDAAARMSQIRTMLRFALLDDPDHPETAIARVDAAMPTLAIDGQATAVVAVVDQDDDERARQLRRLTWTNAGHLPPLLIDPRGEPRLLDTSPDLLLGVRAGTPRHTHTVEVEPHSTLLMFTDGLVERRDATLDDGLNRLLDTARALATHDLTLDEFCDALLERLAPPAERGDDIALVAVRFHPEDRPRPVEAGPEVLPQDHRHALPQLDADPDVRS